MRRRSRRKTGDLAFVELNGRRIYLGKFGTQESRDRYHQVLAEWAASGRHLPAAKNEITVLELIARFWEHAQAYYRNGMGELTGSSEAYKYACRYLKLFGDTPAAEFGPRTLKAVREKMIEARASRRYINSSVQKIKRVFKWAASEDLVPVTVYQSLQSVEGLRRGRCRAREGRTVKPVPLEHVEAAKPFLSRQLQAVVDLQLLTGARSGEVLRLRPADVDRAGKIWHYVLEEHKTAHHDRRRVIYLGPKAQEVLRPFLRDRPLGAYCFSPQEAEEERLAKRHEERKTALIFGNAPGRNRVRNPKRQPTERYTANSYRQAIARACKKAKVVTGTRTS